MSKPILVSHRLCPYVQRAAIALREKQVPFARRLVDLADKPEWFTALSPLGKVPLLRVDGEVLFESAAILEYLEERYPPALHPDNPIARAQHRAWIAFGSSVLDGIAALYNADSAPAFEAATQTLDTRFARIEDELGEGPWFAGARFSLVDTAFAPVLRYFDVLDEYGDLAALTARPKLARWRAALAARTSVRAAVTADYPVLLGAFLAARVSYLSTLMTARSNAHGTPGAPVRPTVPGRV